MSDQGPSPEAGPLLDSAGSPRRSLWLGWAIRLLGYGLGMVSLMFLWLAYIWTILLIPDISPTAAFVIAAGLGFLIVAVALLRRKCSTARLIILVAVYSLFLAALVGLRPEDYEQLDNFRTAYREVRVGMSVKEVRMIIVTHFPDREIRIQVHPEDCFVGPLDPNNGAYNAEFFRLGLKNGIVTYKQYLPD